MSTLSTNSVSVIYSEQYFYSLLKHVHLSVKLTLDYTGLSEICLRHDILSQINLSLRLSQCIEHEKFV